MKERRNLPIGEIDERDSSFRISFGRDLSSLKTSLALSGLLAPLILREKEGGYQVICGFRRLEALRHLGQEGEIRKDEEGGEQVLEVGLH